MALNISYLVYRAVRNLHLSLACNHLLISTNNEVQLRLMCMSLVLRVFGHKVLDSTDDGSI